MNVVILSCANTGNFGDDIILEGIKIKLSTEYPQTGGQIWQVLRINERTINFINEQDILIIGGGELLSHSDILKQIVGHEIKIPYMFLSVGVGSEIDIRTYMPKLHPTVWSVRTENDADILKNCGAKNVIIHMDPIFECPFDRKPNGKMGLCLKNQNKDEKFIEEMAVALDALIKTGVQIDLLALNARSQQPIIYCGEKITTSDCNDSVLMQCIRRKMKNPINTLIYDGRNPLRFLDLLADYDGIVGERLHSVMVAVHARINFKAINYHEKIEKFLNITGLRDKMIQGDVNSIKQSIEKLWIKRSVRPKWEIYEYNT
jgi:polysaccharide pyruvyl transferase WcaK-like protein